MAGLGLDLDPQMGALLWDHTTGYVEQRMSKEAEVMQCYFVSGEYDYFIVVHVINMDAYYQFVRRVISGSGNVRHFHSRFPMKRAKFATKIAFDEKAAEVEVRVER